MFVEWKFSSGFHANGKSDKRFIGRKCLINFPTNRSGCAISCALSLSAFRPKHINFVVFALRSCFATHFKGREQAESTTFALCYLTFTPERYFKFIISDNVFVSSLLDVANSNNFSNILWFSSCAWSQKQVFSVFEGEQWGGEGRKLLRAVVLWGNFENWRSQELFLKVLVPVHKARQGRVNWSRVLSWWAPKWQNLGRGFLSRVTDAEFFLISYSAKLGAPGR